MSDVLKLETPLGVALRKTKLKGKQSILSSLQPLNNDQTRLKTIENSDKSKPLNQIQTIADRFITVKHLGSGGFGEVYLLRFKTLSFLIF